MKLFSLEFLMCDEMQETSRKLEVEQIIETLTTDGNFGVFAHDSEVMGRIYEISAKKLMSEAKWKLAVPVLHQSMDYLFEIGSLRAKTLLKYQLLCSMIAKTDINIFLVQLEDNIYKCDPEILTLLSLYKAF